MAEVLGRLPPVVVLVGIEADACAPGRELSPAVRRALPEFAQCILMEVKRNGVPACAN
jgi:hypothetical protein